MKELRSEVTVKELCSEVMAGFHTGFFAGGGEVIVKVVLACVSTATHMSACEQPRVIWGHVPK